MAMSVEDRRRLKQVRKARESRRSSAELKGSGPNQFTEFASFRAMVSPVLLRALFWIGLVVILGTGGALMWGGDMQRGLGYVAFGPVAWRILCEMLIIFFRIHEDLLEIREELEQLRGQQNGQ